MLKFLYYGSILMGSILTFLSGVSFLLPDNAGSNTGGKKWLRSFTFFALALICFIFSKVGPYSLTKVPDVIDHSYENALNMISDAELRYTVKGLGRFVATQEPNAGEIVCKDSTVTLVMYDRGDSATAPTVTPTEDSNWVIEEDTPATSSTELSVTAPPSRPDPTQLLELPVENKNGKLYTHSFDKIVSNYNSDWNDLDTPGYVPSATDNKGNSYQYGLHLDGGSLGPYFISYQLDGKYTSFTATCAASSITLNSKSAIGYTKYIEVFCDNERVFTSNNMTVNSTPQQINIDVTNVKTLRIQYSATTGSNDLAVIYNGMVQ